MLYAAQESYKSLTLMQMEGRRPRPPPPLPSTLLFFHKGAVFISFLFLFSTYIGNKVKRAIGEEADEKGSLFPPVEAHCQFVTLTPSPTVLPI